MKITPKIWEKLLLNAPQDTEIIYELALMLALDFKHYASEVRKHKKPAPLWSDKDVPWLFLRTRISNGKPRAN